MVRFTFGGGAQGVEVTSASFDTASGVDCDQKLDEFLSSEKFDMLFHTGHFLVEG